MKDEDVNGWHLDKRVPIVLIMTLLVQGAGAVWWLSNLSFRVAQIEATQVNRTDFLKGLTRSLEDRYERIIRLEEKLDYNYKAITRVEQKLDMAIKGHKPER